MQSSALSLSGVTKHYAGVTALKSVSFEANPGEIHALVGENGAGKSTLIGVAAGSISADFGEIRIDGRLLTRADTNEARRLGMAVVYQHPAVLPDLTVEENLILGAPPSERPRGRQARTWAHERLNAVSAAVSPEARIADLSPAGRHFVELARAVALRPKVLVLDEPTEPFSAAEIEILFHLIETLRDQGCCVIYISHRLPDVRHVSDRITVLRDGAIQGTWPTSDVSEEQLVEHIVGAKLEAQFPSKLDQPVSGDRLEVSVIGDRLSRTDFSVPPGEILGLAGIEGNGQREALRIIAGVADGSGSIKKGGIALRFGSSTAALHSGIVHIPADRTTEGLFGDFSVRENSSVYRLRTVSRRGLLSRLRERRQVTQLVEDFQIKTPSLESAVDTLSGGNQQKVLVARSISAEPTVLLADEPTAGVDVGTRARIYTALRDAARRGASVIVTSSDAAELAGLSDRVAVFSSGQIVRTLTGDDVTEDKIVGTALAASPARREQHDSASQTVVRRFLTGDYLPTAVLLVVAAVLVVVATIVNPLFLSDRNLSPLMAQVAILGLVAVAQATVLMVGGVDLSVGPLMGLVTVVASFLLPDTADPGQIALGLVAIALVAAMVGLLNGVLVRYARITPIVATLITFIGLQGVALLLRPSAAGTFSTTLSDASNLGLGPIPGVFLVTVIVAIIGERALRRTRWGLKLRAIGSDDVASSRMSGSSAVAQLGAYLLCSLFAAAAGVLLVAQNNVGDATSGTTYTLTSITAVILGGASLTGGRGSYIGALVGAVVLTLALSATTFFGLSLAWQVAAPGVLILVSAALYSRARLVRSAR